MPDESASPTQPDAAGPVDGRPSSEGEILRGRLKEVSARLEKARRQLDDNRRRLEEVQEELKARAAAPRTVVNYAAPPGMVLLEQERYEDLRQAKRELIRLLRRLGRPPLGWVLRRQKGYRRLRQRWLREG